MQTFSRLRQKLTEAKSKSSVETRIRKETVHHIEYKDEHGRWIRHSTHKSAEDAQKKIPSAKRAVTVSRKPENNDWSDYREPGRDRMFDPKYDR
jgi:hypothetical protein